MVARGGGAVGRRYKWLEAETSMKRTPSDSVCEGECVCGGGGTGGWNSSFEADNVCVDKETWNDLFQISASHTSSFPEHRPGRQAPASSSLVCMSAAGELWSLKGGTGVYMG